MTKAEMNYKRDYGHKDSEELALNYTRDSIKEELDGVLKRSLSITSQQTNRNISTDGINAVIIH